MYNLKFFSYRDDQDLRHTFVNVLSFTEPEKPVLVATGASVQYFKDRDSKGLGQKYALRNALIMSDVPRKYREEIWDVFFNSYSKHAAKLKNKN